MTNLLRTLPWLLLLGCLPLNEAHGQETLTLRQAIQVALKQSPSGQAARADVEEARATARLARTQLLPQLSFTEDVSRGDDPVYAFGTRLRQQRFTQADFALDALNKPDAIGNFSTRISGSWVAFDSWKTQITIRSADWMKKSSTSSAGAIDQQIVLGVVQAYQEVLYAERQVEMAQHALETSDALLAAADDHVKAGLAVDSDRRSAQVNAASRKQGLIAAQGSLELAWVRLRVATGDPKLTQTHLAPLEEKAFAAGDLEQEFQTALHNRQDLAALAQAQEAQGAEATAARLGFGPRVSVYGTWENDQSSPGGSSGSNWVAGVQMSVDLLPLRKRAQVAREHAAKSRVDAQVSSFQQQVRLQVSQAHIQRETAQLSVNTARAAIEQASESLRILQNRYAAGLANITDVLRAEDAERQSRSDYWRAVYGNTVAYAELLFATGTLTADAAEDLQ